MKPRVCTYGDARDEILVSYLYDEIAADERARFEQHLSGCALCRGEMDGLAAMRTHLGRWSTPEPGVRLTTEVAPGAQPTLRPERRALQIPAWAQAAAAVLLVGLALGAANLNVSYTREGLSIHTGWMKAHGAANPSTEEAQDAGVDRHAAGSWQTDLAALEERLRAELLDQRTSAEHDALQRSARSSDEDLIARVRGLLRESERRQQRELALRVAEVARDLQTERRADLVKIDRSLGIIQNRTGLEVMRQQQLLNNLLRVSQKQ